MRRRAFLGTALAAAASLALPAAAASSPAPAAGPPGLKQCYRWDGRQWRRCRMCLLKKGDRIRLIQDGEGVEATAVSNPYWVSDPPPGCVPGWGIHGTIENYV